MSILKADFSRKGTGVKTYQFILGSQINLRPKIENGISRKRKLHTNIFLEAKCPNFSKAYQQYIERVYVIPAYLCSVVQSCPTLCNSMPCSPPGFSVHEILQARILERLPLLTPRNLPDPGIELASPVGPALQLDSLPAEPSGKPPY